MSFSVIVAVSAATELPAMSSASVLIGSSGCCFTPTCGEQNFQGKRCCLLESIVFRWQLLQNSPANPPLLLFPCVWSLVSFQAYAPPFECTATFISSLFPCHCSSLLRQMRPVRLWRQSPDLWLLGWSPYGRQCSAQVAFHLECPNTLWRLFDVSILRYSKSLVEQIILPGPR